MIQSQQTFVSKLNSVHHVHVKVQSKENPIPNPKSYHNSTDLFSLMQSSLLLLCFANTMRENWGFYFYGSLLNTRHSRSFHETCLKTK